MHTHKEYQAQWHAIKQTHGQTEQELANEIREVYEDVYPHKDNWTKKEELLSKFLEVLADPNRDMPLSTLKILPPWMKL